MMYICFPLIRVASTTGLGQCAKNSSGRVAATSTALRQRTRIKYIFPPFMGTEAFLAFIHVVADSVLVLDDTDFECGSEDHHQHPEDGFNWNQQGFDNSNLPLVHQASPYVGSMMVKRAIDTCTTPSSQIRTFHTNSTGRMVATPSELNSGMA